MEANGSKWKQTPWNTKYHKMLGLLGHARTPFATFLFPLFEYLILENGAVVIPTQCFWENLHLIHLNWCANMRNVIVSMVQVRLANGHLELLDLFSFDWAMLRWFVSYESVRIWKLELMKAINAIQVLRCLSHLQHRLVLDVLGLGELWESTTRPDQSLERPLPSPSFLFVFRISMFAVKNLDHLTSRENLTVTYSSCASVFSSLPALVC